jgi:hypothetical protein
VTHGPEPATCFHEGRYYDEGDLATSDDNWCTGLICKEGDMISWDDCEVKPETTKSSTVTQTPVASTIPDDTPTPLQETTEDPKSTPKPLKSTPPVPESSTETPVTATVSHETTTKASTIFYTDVTSKPPDTTAEVSLSSTGVPYTATEMPDSTTMTTDIPTTPQKTTPTPPPETTKPESQRCLYEGKLYPPGEVTQGVLRDGRCFGVMCDISGVILQWVTAHCTPTEPPTTEIKGTLPGCVYNDKYYPPGRISRISNGISRWCLDVMCTEEGKIATANNVDCDDTTTSKPTESTMTCLYNGMCVG